MIFLLKQQLTSSANKASVNSHMSLTHLGSRWSRTSETRWHGAWHWHHRHGSLRHRLLWGHHLWRHGLWRWLLNGPLGWELVGHHGHGGARGWGLLGRAILLGHLHTGRGRARHTANKHPAVTMETPDLAVNAYYMQQCFIVDCYKMDVSLP